MGCYWLTCRGLYDPVSCFRRKVPPWGGNIDWNKGQNIIFRDIFPKSLFISDRIKPQACLISPLIQKLSRATASSRSFHFTSPHVEISLHRPQKAAGKNKEVGLKKKKKKTAEDTNRTLHFYHRQIFPCWCFALQTSGRSNDEYQSKNLSGKIKNSCLNSLFMTYCAFWRLFFFFNAPQDMRTTST